MITDYAGMTKVSKVARNVGQMFGHKLSFIANEQQQQQLKSKSFPWPSKILQNKSISRLN